MRILVVVSGNHAMVAPFVTEQVAALRKVGCEVEQFCVTGHGLFGYLQNLKPIKTAIKSYSPDIIHAHYGLCGLLCTLQHKVPVVVTYHGSDINNPLMLRFSRLAMCRAAHNIFVSKKLQQKATKTFSLFTSSVLPCGIDTTTFHPMNRKQACQLMELDITQHYILFAGAFDNEVKNPQLAKEAFNLFASSLPDERMVGWSEKQKNRKTENPQSSEYQNIRHPFHLLELTGYNRKEVALLMNAADCMLMTSHSEGSPQVIKEALACGCPVVSVDVGDVVEITKDIDGCHVSFERDATSLAKLLDRVIQRQERIHTSRQSIISRLDNINVANKLISLYQSLL